MKRKGSLRNRIPVLRAEKRWTQQELAQRLGVSRQTIVSMESNRYSPSLVLAFQLARLFDIDINEIFEYVEEGEGT